MKRVGPNTSRMWNLHIDKVLGEFGLKRLQADFRFYKIGEGVERVLLGLYVDDMFMLGEMKKMLAALQEFLCTRFRMKPLGEVKYLLGMEIRKQPNGDIWL